MAPGVDPTLDQWRDISKLMKDKQLFPYFDMAYQVLCRLCRPALSCDR